MTDEKQQRIDESLAKQLQRSMELNARMKNRLQKLIATEFVYDNGDNEVIRQLLEEIINDEDPKL